MLDNQEEQSAKLLFSSWGHNLEKDAMIIRDSVYLVRHELTKPLPNFEHINRKLDMIDRVSNEIARTPSPYEVGQVNLNLLIRERAERARATCSRIDAAIEFSLDLDQGQPMVNANSVWLGRVLDILLDNASQAVSETEDKRIAVRSMIDRQGVTVVVRDTGKGIQKELLPELFQRPLPPLSRPRGKGLYIAQLAVDIYGGRIEVTDTTSTGTTMTLWLPLEKIGGQEQ